MRATYNDAPAAVARLEHGHCITAGGLIVSLKGSTAKAAEDSVDDPHSRRRMRLAVKMSSTLLMTMSSVTLKGLSLAALPAKSSVGAMTGSQIQKEYGARINIVTGTKRHTQC